MTSKVKLFVIIRNKLFLEETVLDEAMEASHHMRDTQCKLVRHTRRVVGLLYLRNQC